MKRDINQLNDATFDLMIIGGGIYGAWTAYDATLRGLNVLLIDKNDWASGTSSASSKLIHGGLRYLEQFRFNLVRKSLIERELLCQLGPHRINHLRFFIPIFNNCRVSNFQLKTGLLLYDLIAGVNHSNYKHDYYSRYASAREFSFLKYENLKCGYSYSDAQTDDFRYTLEIIDGAIEAGATCLNHLEAKNLIIEKKSVTGANLIDCLTGIEYEIKANVTVNLAGPWIGSFSGDDSITKSYCTTKGIHLVLPALPTEHAILKLTKREKRIIFLIPWYGKTLLGTTDTFYDKSPDDIDIDERDVHYLLDEGNDVLSGAPWDTSTILGSFSGLRTLQSTTGATPSAISREWQILNPFDNYFVSVGGKLTSARIDAVEIVDQVFNVLRREKKSITHQRQFPWAPAYDTYCDWYKKTVDICIMAGMDHDVALQCVRRYGTKINLIVDIINKTPGYREKIHPDVPFCKAEIIHSIGNEMAMELDDIFRRRIPLIILVKINKQDLQESVSLAAKELKWSAAVLTEKFNIFCKSWNLN